MTLGKGNIYLGGNVSYETHVIYMWFYAVFRLANDGKCTFLKSKLVYSTLYWLLGSL